MGLVPCSLHETLGMNGKRLGEPVEHYYQGKDAWRTGLSGFLLRRRAIFGVSATTILFTLLTAGQPWWWPKKFPKIPGTVSTSLATAVCVLILGAMAVAFMVVIRNRELRHARLGNRLHSLAHYLRDWEVRISEGEGHLSGDDKFGLLAFADGACERIRKVFSVLTGDRSVNAAVRLAVLAEAGSPGAEEMVVYRTIGRSTGLNQNRAATTVDVPANGGVAGYLMKEGGAGEVAHGVLFYHDISAAAQRHAYSLSENDSRYKGEVTTMIVAPLNAWDGKGRSMIGLLYVTSGTTGTFRDDHIEYMKMIADTLAPTLSHLVWGDQVALASEECRA